ncbi:MAG: SH3 domain-containing protein [Deltaproteobacteria bacterium]|nr:SH3 domain-containing protein [Deltaproteobacteria bacterium]
MADPRPTTKVTIPTPEQEQPGWRRVGIFAAVGLVIGVAWPTVAGIRVGPDVPGSKTKPVATSQAGVPSPSAGATSKAPSLAKPAPSAAVTHKQTVVVSGGEITRCYQRKKKLGPEECGVLRVDRVLAPRLEQLAGCPSALGLQGELVLGFDLNFDKKEISVIRGKKSALPSSTVRGIIACAADYMRDVSPEKIAHKYSRYRVFYTLSFYPPGAAPNPQGAAEEAAAEADAAEARGLATVNWDTALVRDEPRSGAVIARLVRGTRVKLLGRRKDWYRVKVRSKEGWVYRGALGL